MCSDRFHISGLHPELAYAIRHSLVNIILAERYGVTYQCAMKPIISEQYIGQYPRKYHCSSSDTILECSGRWRGASGQ